MRTGYKVWKLVSGLLLVFWAVGLSPVFAQPAASVAPGASVPPPVPQPPPGSASPPPPTVNPSSAPAPGLPVSPRVMTPAATSTPSASPTPYPPTNTIAPINPSVPEGLGAPSAPVQSSLAPGGVPSAAPSSASPPDGHPQVPQHPALDVDSGAPADTVVAPSAAPNAVLNAPSTTQNSNNSTHSRVDAKAPSDAELAAELARLGVSSNTPPSDPGSVLVNLGFYGFADFMFNKSLDTEVNSVLWPYDSFSVGNLNLYWGGNLGSNWQTLAEVRFTYLPHGASTFTPGGMARTNTTVGDYNDYDRPLRWGGIEIERVWVEYVAHSLLTLRFGQWLTPYGIWNVDHGSPVIIGVVRPFVIGEQLFPERQTGIELYGAWQFENSELSYHLTLSNGRGALDAFKDLDDNKAIGARVQWRSDDDWGRLALGGSLYYGRHTDSTLAYVPNDSGGFDRTFDATEQYDETGLALDLKYEREGYLLQGELLVQDKVFTPNNRPAAMTLDGGPVGFMSDERRWGTYVLTGYRTPWFGVMPFVGLEYYASDNAFSNPALATFLGINARVAAAVVLKAQWTHSWFPNLEPSIAPPADNLFLQIAWSF